MKTDRRRAAATHLVVAVVAAFMLFPVLWALSASFKAPSELYGLGPVAEHPTLDNYRAALTEFPMARLLLNTTIMAVCVTAGQVLLAILAGYGFAVFDFRGRRLLFGAAVVTILVPQQCLIIPSYIMVAKLGWLDGYLGLVVPLTATCAFGVLLLRQHMEAIPKSLLEAARLDGAGHRDTLWRVVVPSVRPAIGALAILTFIASWNEYLWPLLVTPSKDATTIQVGLQLFQTQEGSEYGPMMAAATLATTPILIVYMIGRRRVTDAFLQAGIR